MDPIPIQRHDNVPPDAGLRSVGVDARFEAPRESEGRGEDDIAVAAKSGGLPAAPERGVHRHVERVRGCFVHVLQRVLRGMGPSGRTERDLPAGGDLVVRRRRERERETPPVVGRRGVSPDAPIGAAAQASRSLREVRLGGGKSRPRCELPVAEAAVGGGGEDDRRGVRTAPRRLLPEEGGWKYPAEDEGGLGDGDDDASGEEGGGGGVELLGGRHRGGEKSHAGEAAQEGALGEVLQPRKGQGRAQEAESKAVFARPYIDISNAGGCASRFFECIRLQLKFSFVRSPSFSIAQLFGISRVIACVVPIDF